MRSVQKLPKGVIDAGGSKMLYSVTKDGKIKLHRDLAKWKMKTVNKSHALYYDEAQSPKEARAEKEFKSVISRCTKELSLDSECALAVKDMRKQEYLDHLADI
jgi:hypothetical protein